MFIKGEAESLQGAIAATLSCRQRPRPWQRRFTPFISSTSCLKTCLESFQWLNFSQINSRCFFLSFWTADLWDGSRPLSSLGRADRGPDTVAAESARCAASNKAFHGEVAVQHEARGAHFQQLWDRFICLHPLSCRHHLKWFQIANSPETILFLCRCRLDPDPLLSVIPLTFLWLFKPMVSIQYHFPLCKK